MTLDQPALVLNRHWVPIGTVPVRAALCLLYRQAARAILPQDYSLHDFDSWSTLRVADDEPCIATVSLKIKVPEVLLLTNYSSFPQRRVTFSRKNLYRRDHYMCQYCGARPQLQDLSIDHVTPRSRGGRSSWGNCVLACIRCNRKKANRTLQEAGLHLQRDPKEPRWSPFVSIPIAQRRTSWEQFISHEYWNVELER